MNCWEFKKCGRELNGAKVDELGVCPAFSKNAGQACWLVAGTFCDGNVQGSYGEKKTLCDGCDFFRRLEASRSKIIFERSVRVGEQGPPPMNRSRRAYQSGGSWYFATREGVVMGPYDSRTEVNEAVQGFIEFMGIASDEMIAKFIDSSAELKGGHG